MSALRYITSASCTASTNLKVENVFSTDYDVYMVQINNHDGNGTDCDLLCRFVNLNGIILDSSYDDAVLLQRAYGVAGDQNDQNETEFGSLGFYSATTFGQEKGMGTTFVINPADGNSYTFARWENAGISHLGTPARRGIAVHKQAETVTGLFFLGNSSQDLDLEMDIYGIRRD